MAEKKREEEEKKRKEEREALALYREERWASYPRGDADGMIQYLLETEENEMEFELTRVKPDLAEPFFEALKARIEAADGEEKEKLQGLDNVTREFAEYIDKVSKALASPADRLRDLLKSPNKKQHIREMAINKEIDTNLLALLQANIDGAQKAGQVCFPCGIWYTGALLISTSCFTGGDSFVHAINFERDEKVCKSIERLSRVLPTHRL